MVNIIEIIKSFDDYIGGTGCCEKQIGNAEKQLGLLFAEDYRLYLRKVGLAYFNGHELTGIGNIDRLNVVTVTQQKKSSYAGIPDRLYVIEDIGIDGVLMWQSQEGAIYQSLPGNKIEKVYDSLIEYIETL